ncbi:MAG: T9SS type A sorting domain-containing protein [Bacteriovoracaceae bacterium]
MFKLNRFVLFLSISSAMAPLYGQSFRPWYESPVNGQVNSIVVAGNTAYLGGDFTLCGFSTGYGAAIDTASADADHSFPKFFRTLGGQVWTAVPDSQGGWYIGGSFLTVNGQPHKFLAHVRADKSVDPWNPSPNQTVKSIYYSGNKIYVGGSFDSIAGQPRGHGAAFDTSGNLLLWNPKADNDITAIQPVGAKVFVGGGFYSLGGQPYHFLLGSVDTSAGLLTGWNPSNGGPSGSFGIYKFIYTNHQIFMVGSFSTLNGVARICLAKMDENGIINTTWNPAAMITGNFVKDICLYNGVLYASGDFTALGGQTRKNIAALDTVTGLATAWIPASTNGPVHAITVNGSKMFIGGGFTTLGGKQISFLGAMDAATGSALTWNPGVNNVVFNLAPWGSVVYAGGYFTASGLITRNRLAAIDLGTGRLKSWNPNSDGPVYAMAYANGRVYAGGNFSYIASGNRSNVTALDTLNGAYVPSGIVSAPGGTVLALAVIGNRLYAGGNYGLIAYNIPTGKKLSFTPVFDYPVVHTLCASDSVMYVGGTFSQVNGLNRSMVVAFDTTTDQPTIWNPTLSNTCYSIAVAGSTIYLGGSFSTVNGSSSPSIAAVNASTGVLQDGFTSYFSPIGYKVSTVAVGGNQLYVGGQFSPIDTIAGTDYLAILNAKSGAVSSFRSGMVASEVKSIVLLPQTALVGGSFITYTNWPHYNFVGYGDTSIHSIGFPVLQVRSNPTDFDTVVVGETKSEILYLMNTGTDTLHIKSIIVNDSLFTSHIMNAVIPPKQTILDTLRFTPQSEKKYSSSILITSDAESSPETVFLYGVGIEKKFVKLLFNKEPILFGGIKIGAVRDTLLSVMNVGNDTAKVTVTSSDSVFTFQPATFSLEPDSANIFLLLRFHPVLSGEYIAQFVIANSRTTPSSDTIQVTGIAQLVNEIAEQYGVPKEYSLSQNYPNPFNPSTTIQYQLPNPGLVTLTVFDVLGKEVATPVHQRQDAGTYRVSVNAEHLTTGVYFYSLRSGRFVQTKKCMFIK